MPRKNQIVVTGIVFAALGAAASADVTGEGASVANTFEDAVFTGGLQTIFGIGGPAEVVDPGVEFPGFIGFYDIDLTGDSLTMTLIDNSGATDLIIPAGRFDRYYFQFDVSEVTSATLNGADELNEFANVTVLAPGFTLDVADLFGTGIDLPIEFENGGFVVEFGEGTDLTNLGVQATVNFTSIPTPATMAIFGAAGVVAARRRRA